MDRNFFVLVLPYPSNVVPYVGTWIEILSASASISAGVVVPYVGTWIEIS